MTRRLLLTFAIVAALLLSAAPAGAHAPAPAGGWVATWKTAAVAYWAAQTPADEQPDCVDIGIGFGHVPDGDLGVNDAPCHVTFDRAQWQAMPDLRLRCPAVVHEIGHVFGRLHTRSSGIMAHRLIDQPVWTRVPVCAATMRRHRTRSGGWTIVPAPLAPAVA